MTRVLGTGILTGLSQAGQGRWSQAELARIGQGPLGWAGHRAGSQLASSVLTQHGLDCAQLVWAGRVSRAALGSRAGISWGLAF